MVNGRDIAVLGGRRHVLETATSARAHPDRRRMSAGRRSPGGHRMRTIDFENHFVTQEWVDALLANDGHPRLVDDKATGKLRLYYQADAFEPFGVMPKLLDLGEGRIAEMDAVGVDVAVLSLTAPGCEQLGAGGRDPGSPRAQRRAGGGDREAPRSLRRATPPCIRRTPMARSRSSSAASKSWASRAGRRTPTSATRSWTRSATGRSWPRRRSSACRSTCTRRRR